MVPYIRRPPACRGPEGSIAPTAFAALIYFLRAFLTETTASDIPLIKRRLRREARKLRLGLPPELHHDGVQAIRDAGLAFLGGRRGTTVSGYVATRGELDVLPLLHALYERGLTIALPVVPREGHVLIFRAHHPGGELHRAGFGLLEPGPEAEAVTPSVLLVPLLAFDRQGRRLGYGGGYYDTTLKHLRARDPGVTAIGIGFDEQELPEVPWEPHDELLDWVLTPSGLIRCGG